MWGKPQHEILDIFTTRELDELRAFQMLEPFGPREDRMRIFEIVAAIYTSIPKADTASKKTFTADDFMPSWEQIEERFFAEPESKGEKMQKAREQLKALAAGLSRQKRGAGKLAGPKVPIRRGPK